MKFLLKIFNPRTLDLKSYVQLFRKKRRASLAYNRSKILKRYKVNLVDQN